MTMYTTDDQYPEGGNYKPGDICKCTNPIFPVRSWVYTGREWVINAVTAETDPLTGGIGLSAAGIGPVPMPPAGLFPVAKYAGCSSGMAYSTLASATFSGTNGSGVLDTVTGPYGNNPAILTVNAGSTGNFAQLVDTTIPGAFLDDGGQMVIVAEIVSGMDSLDQISVIFSSDGAATKTATVVFKIDKNRGKLFFIRLYPGTNEFTFAGSESFANTMNYMAIKVDSAGGTTGGVVKIHGVWRYQRTRTKVVIGFDDGWKHQYNNFYQYMVKRGLVGYVAASVDYVGGNYMSSAQMDELYQAGWDITVHGSKNHNDGTLTTQELLQAEVKRNLDYIIGQGWTRGVSTYVFPGGTINSSTGSKQVLANLGFKIARVVSFGAGGTGDETMPTVWGLDDPYVIHGRDLSGSYSAASDLSLVDRAIDNGSSVWYYGHKCVRTSPSTDEMTFAEFQTFIDGIADRKRDGKIDVILPSEFARIFT